MKEKIIEIQEESEDFMRGLRINAFFFPWEVIVKPYCPGCHQQIVCPYDWRQPIARTVRARSELWEQGKRRTGGRTFQMSQGRAFIPQFWNIDDIQQINFVLLKLVWGFCVKHFIRYISFSEASSHF